MTAVPPSRRQFAQEWLEGTQKIAKVVTMSQSYSLTADVPKKKSILLKLQSTGHPQAHICGLKALNWL